MVAGEKPQVAGWDAMEPMKRLEYEFASAVRSPDPAVAYLATLTVCTTYSRAVGPELTAALRQNMTSKDLRLQVQTVAGLVTIGDLDTIYELKDIFQRWEQDPKTADAPSEVASDGLDMVTGKNAVPALVQLSTNTNAYVRAGATASLYHIGGKDVVAALAERLSDESRSVRYSAIKGLAQELEPSDVGAKDWQGWAPAVDRYKEDPDTPVNNWKNWWDKTSKAKYPSVDSVLAKAQRFRTERPWAKTAAAPGGEAPAN